MSATDLFLKREHFDEQVGIPLTPDLYPSSDIVFRAAHFLDPIHEFFESLVNIHGPIKFRVNPPYNSSSSLVESSVSS